MRILITSLYNGQLNRGLESWVYQIFKYLKRSGLEVKVVQGGADIPDWVEDRDDIISEYTPALDLTGDARWVSKVRKRLRVHQLDFDVRLFQRKTEKYILELEPDILIPAGGVGIPPLRRLIRKNALRTKIMCVGHAGLDRVARAGLDRGLAAADAFVALSSQDYQTVKVRYPGIRLFQASNGVDLDLFRQVTLDRNVVTKYANLPKPIVLCVSSLVKCKRVEMAIRAVSNIEGASLIVLGEGSMRTALDQVIKREVPSRRRSHFLLLDSVPFNKMPTFYSLADVFVHPADSTEVFGSVIVEAMAMGKPVIVNDDPARRAIVGSVGYLVDPTDVNRLSKLIVSAHNKSDASTRNATIERANEYSWDNVVEQYIGAFEELVGSR